MSATDSSPLPETDASSPTPTSALDLLPAPSELAALPSSRGPAGHVRYTLAALKQRRLLRTELDAHDAALRAAVGERDAQLVALGEATLSAPTLEARATAFQATLEALDTDQGTATRTHDALQTELTGAEADRRAAEARFDGRLENLRAELRPLERQIDAERRALEPLIRERDAAEKQRSGHEDRLAHPKVEAEPTPEAAARAADERTRHTEAVTRLQSQIGALVPRIEALEATLGEDAGRRTLLNEEIAATEAERSVVVGAAQARESELRQEATEARRRLDAIDARRRAALIDLGREMVEANPSATGEFHAAARTALSAIGTIRRARNTLEARRNAIDLGPVRRTIGTGAALLLVLFFWWVTL